MKMNIVPAIAVAKQIKKVELRYTIILMLVQPHLLPFQGNQERLESLLMRSLIVLMTMVAVVDHMIWSKA